LEIIEIRTGLVRFRILKSVRARVEKIITWGMISLSGILTGANLAPRLITQPVGISQSQPEIVVAVTGAVRNPGNYNLAWGGRVEDAIAAAGGFSGGAEKDLINLAAPIDNGEAIFVPSIKTQSGEKRISINSASQQELELLPRIGPAMAKRIIMARPFMSVDDLLKVKGIGPKTFEKLIDKISL